MVAECFSSSRFLSACCRLFQKFTKKLGDELVQSRQFEITLTSNIDTWAGQWLMSLGIGCPDFISIIRLASMTSYGAIVAVGRCNRTFHKTFVTTAVFCNFKSTLIATPFSFYTGSIWVIFCFIVAVSLSCARFVLRVQRSLKLNAACKYVFYKIVLTTARPASLQSTGFCFDTIKFPCFQILFFSESPWLVSVPTGLLLSISRVVLVVSSAKTCMNARQPIGIFLSKASPRLRVLFLSNSAFVRLLLLQLQKLHSFLVQRLEQNSPLCQRFTSDAGSNFFMPCVPGAWWFSF